jgi:protein-ribulosamine 3-kinase
VTVPKELRAAFEAELGECIVSAVAIGGGCISNTTRLILSNGTSYMAKWGTAGLFAAEAEALNAIGATRTVRVPQVAAVNDYWLIEEWLEPGPMGSAAWQKLGRGLARLHRVSNDRFGWTSDNYIGSLPQTNAFSNDWCEFWRERRIIPQLERASELSRSDRKRIESLITRDDLIAIGNEEGPSLLHGDLWNGNVHGVRDGEPSVIDPSIYYGHREVDLAMARLFGGFSGEFFDAYNEAWPLQEGAEERCSMYQLYYMLVHVNLFGGSYVSGTMSLVRKLGF